MTVASQVLGAMLILMSETLLFTVTSEGMEPVKNIGWWCLFCPTRGLQKPPTFFFCDDSCSFSSSSPSSSSSSSSLVSFLSFYLGLSFSFGA